MQYNSHVRDKIVFKTRQRVEEGGHSPPDVCQRYDASLDATMSKNKDFSYDKIYNGTLKEQIKIFRKMKINLENRENYDDPSDLFDPLICQ